MPDDKLANLLCNKLIASHFSMGALSIQHEVPCTLAVTVCLSMMMIYMYMYKITNNRRHSKTYYVLLRRLLLVISYILSCFCGV